MGLFDRLKKTRPRDEEAAREGAGAPDGHRFRARDTAVFSLGDGTRLVHARDHARAQILPDALGDLLREMNAFRTVAEHANAIGASMGFDEAERTGLEKELRSLIDAGLAYNFDEVIALLSARGEAVEPPPKIEHIAVLTCDRTPFLARLAGSIAQALDRAGRSAELLVFDDSKSDEKCAANRAALSSSAARSVRYAGREEKSRYKHQLARELGFDVREEELLDFALFGIDGAKRTTGANQNASLFELAGRLVLSFDDDTVCRFARAPGFEPGLAIASAHDAMEFSFFRDRSAALAAASFEPAADPLAIHERLLGRDPGACVAALSAAEPCALDNASAALLRRLLSPGAKSRVAATMTGIAGDSAMGSTAYYLSREGAARERLLEAYAQFRTTREVLRAAPRETITESSLFMTTCFGADLRAIVPPFLPVLRNSDGIWAAMLRMIDPLALIGHVPWMIEHAPEQRAIDMPAVVRAFVETRAADLIVDLSRRTYFPLGQDPEDRLISLGRNLRAAGNLPEAELAELVLFERRRSMVESIVFFEALLERHGGEPEEWASDVGEILGALRAAQLEASRSIPRDLAETGGEAGALAALGRLFRRFGELLETWPAILRGARALAARGERLTRSL